jgi:hypothetical protein
MPWTATDYVGGVVFRGVNANVSEIPLRRFDDLQEGLPIWVPTPSGGFYEATVQWDTNGGFFWRCGSSVGWLAFSEGGHGCWVSTGAARLVMDE